MVLGFICGIQTQYTHTFTAGPREDIVVPLSLASNGMGGLVHLLEDRGTRTPNGFLASSLQEFTDAIMQVRHIIQVRVHCVSVCVCV